MKRRSMFSLMRLLLLIAAIPLGASFAQAGAGIGYSTDLTGASVPVQTYYANSVSIPDAQGVSSQFMRKFVDGLPGLGAGAANNLGQYLPVATPEKWVNGNGVLTGDDYYEIGIVEYSERLHSDLPKATTLRGYVQLETPALAAAGKSKHIALKYPDGTPILNTAHAQIYAVDIPHYLGPVIVATRNTAVRVKYSNLLPNGGFDAATGKRNGDLFLPVDKTLMGAGTGPVGGTYTENRAEIHLHGGDNPWISDGTPHQWTVPAGENTPYQVGASFQNVPDMPDPGPGSGTLYFPNGDSARLMFYHDHTAGLTRLNVYAGEAAGYLINDQPGTGENLLPLPASQIPLVLQEKTFVPADVAVQDARWDTVHWGQPGDLWYPHVYEINQNPDSFDGTNPVGRWDWGPWFWPVFPVTDPLPTGVYGDVTATPEDFGDTPLINGTAYPVLNVDPKAYRLRILNASNSRMFNIGLYLADPTVVTADGRTGTEVEMVPSAPPTASSIPRACKDTDPVNPTTGLQVSAAAETIHGTVVPAGTACWPATWPTDGRDGGVPTPGAAGPKLLQIGSEGGLLPKLAVIPSNPTNFEYMRRSVTVLNVSDHGLFLGSAERADVVVDFSQYAGQTLILFNDMAAPVPAFDARIDYYTDAPDQSASGGWFPTPAGFGPNTRTMMQIKVSGTIGQNGTPFDEAALAAALPAAFAATQPKPVVAESAYNTALGTSYGDTYARIFTGSINQHTFNFTAADTVSYFPEGASSMVTVNAGQAAAIPVLNKTIQELFDSRGRMNATLGVEIPYTGANIQTTVPLGYIDPATESIADGETQIWKITHNGVDTHPIHFHLVNVQVINRIGWDGTVKPIADNEYGWKETVKMHPLEDVVVAVRAKKPTLPGFGLPHSIRLLDPSQPAGATMGFSNLDPLTGNPYPAGSATVNALTDFGWEYVWHCHILGHEENDFMRPFIFHITESKPLTPSNLAATQNATQVKITWKDNSVDETNYRVERASIVNNKVGSYAVLGTILANATSYTDAAAVLNNIYSYRIVAHNSAGENSATITVDHSRFTGSIVINGGAATTSSLNVTLALSASSISGAVTQMQFSTNGGTSWTALEAYATTRSFTLPATGNGLKTVSVRFKDAAGNLSAIYTGSITFSGILPTGTIAINGGAATTTSSSVVLTLSASGASTVTQMQFSVNGGSSWTTAQSYATTKTITLSTPYNGVKTVAVRYIDAVGNVSAAISASITVNPPAPTGTISINGGALTTTSPSVTLTLSATGLNPVTQMQFSKDGGLTWTAVEAYATTRVITLASTGNGLQTVSVRYIDSVAKVSAAYLASITLNAPLPTGTILINGGATSTASAAVTLTLSATSPNTVTLMQFSKDGGAWSTPEPFATSRVITLAAPFNGLKSVAVRYLDAAGNQSVPITGTITITPPPPTGTISINGGAVSTTTLNVTLTLSATGLNPVVSMQFSRDGGATWSAAEPYATTRALALLNLANGPQTVSVRYIDSVGNVSAGYPATITLNVPLPAGTIAINGGAASTNSSSVVLTLSASGVNAITQMQFSKDGGAWSPAETFVTTRVVTLAAPYNGTKTVAVRYIDLVGNVSPAFSASINLIPPPPTGTIAINGGAATTASPSVSLTLSASGLNPVVSMQFSKDGGATWTPLEPYATTRAATLLPIGNGPQSISVRFLDSAGNLSQATSASITLNAPLPTGTIVVNGGATTATSTSVALTLSASSATGAVVSMQFSKDGGATWSVLEPYATTRAVTLAPAGPGLKTIAVRYLDATGNLSLSYQASITVL
jgi:FtsP/CotA-like multicopper oxidase with cupredoxin domain